MRRVEITGETDSRVWATPARPFEGLQGERPLPWGGRPAGSFYGGRSLHPSRWIPDWGGGANGRGSEGEGNHDGRSYGLRQEGGYACASASGVDDHPAAARNIFEKVDEARIGLGVGLPRPPMALDDGEGGQPGPEAIIKHLEFADSYDGGVLGGLKALETDVSRLFRFAGEVDAGYVDSAWNGGTDSTVLATK